jgi:adenylylsulfate kinase-like enzyme
MIDAGLVTIAAFVSPMKKDREMIQMIVGENNFFEVYVNTTLEECERRDVKGLYAKARAGEIKDFTGISSPYEPPVKPDLEIDTLSTSAQEAVERIINLIEDKLTLQP